MDNSQDTLDTMIRKYNNYLSKIFSWGVFRNKAPGDRSILNLDPMREACAYFGNPQKGNFKVIHIAGTNGKGSVSYKTASALKEMGFKVGMFTSPHISSFRERIQIDGELCPMQDIVDTCDHVFKVVEEKNLDLRFFEIVTLLGFIEFRKHACDYVVLECGLGGRIDATNIVEYPELVCSVVTSIGMDHMDVLGDTIEDIAGEKAAIIKHNVPVVLGPSCQPLKAFNQEFKTTIHQIDTGECFCYENNKIVNKVLDIVSQIENKPLPVDIDQKIKQWS